MRWIRSGRVWQVPLLLLALCVSAACQGDEDRAASAASSYGSAEYSGRFELRDVSGAAMYVITWDRSGADEFRITVRRPPDSEPTLSAARNGSAGSLCSLQPMRVCYAADEFVQVFGGDADIVRLLWHEQPPTQDVLANGLSAQCYESQSERECFSDDGVPLLSTGPIAKSISLLAQTQITPGGLVLESSPGSSQLQLVAITVAGSPDKNAFEIEDGALPFPGILPTAVP